MIKKTLEHKITYGATIAGFIIISGIVGYLLIPTAKHELVNTNPNTMTIRQLVNSDGKIDSDRHISLNFAKSAQITSVKVKVGDPVKTGDILVTMDPKQLTSSLTSAKADLISAQANLSALKKGATSQTIAVYNQNISTAQLTLSTAIRDVYLKAQDLLLNKINIFFTNNSSVNPDFKITTDSYAIKNNINNSRLLITDRVNEWNSDIQINPISDKSLSETKENIAFIKDYLNTLSGIINKLTSGGSGISQNVIDSYVATMNSATAELNTAETEYNSAIQAYKTNTDQLAVVQASSTPEALEIAQANVIKAQANISSIQSQINDMILIAPFDGIVASVNPRVGETFPAGSPAIDIISPGAYKIDVMVSENEVSAISIGDSAIISLNTYGNNLTATGTVSSIDLSKTMINGVGSYKTTITLNNTDSRIRTGMNVNVSIQGISSENAIVVPTSAIIKKTDGNYVLVQNNKGQYEEQKVVVGITNTDMTEIKSGINVDQKIATFGNSNN